MVDDVKYEFKSVKAIRGMEARSIAKWQTAGWELDDQSASTLHTTLNFRRVKPKIPWLPIATLGGVALLIALVVGIGTVLEGGADKDPALAKPTTSANDKPSAAPAETYAYEGPRYEIVTVDKDVSNAHLDQYWVYTSKFDYSTDAFREQVKLIISDIAHREQTPKLIVQVVTDKEIIEAEAISTGPAFMDEHDGKYWRNVMVPKEKTDWVAWYTGGFDPDAGDAGEPSDSASAFQIDWLPDGVQGNEKWKPEL